MKGKVVEDLRESLLKSSAVFMADFTGLTVQDMVELRRKLKGAGGGFKVVKNTLYRIALSSTPHEVLKEHTSGPTGVAFSFEDPVAIAKLLVEFSKDNPSLELKCASLEGRLLGEEEVKKLAKLPPKEQLLGQFVGVLSMVPRRFLYVLKAKLIDFVSVLKAIEEKKRENA